MDTPIDRIIAVASGGTALVGRTTAVPGGGSLPPSGNAAWRTTAGAAVNKVVAIAGTSDLKGASFVWSGWAADLDRNKLWFAAAGGHTDSSNNGVYELDLSADSPAWSVISTPTVNPVYDIQWQADGKPTSAHTYDYCHWVPSVGRIMRHQTHGNWINAYDFSDIQTFNPDANPPVWDAPGTFPTVPNNGTGCAVDHVHSEVFTSEFKMYRAATKTYANTATRNTAVETRYPVAYSTADDLFFCLQWGNGQQGYAPYPGSPLNASYIKRLTGSGAQTAVTFNSSAAYTQFLAEAQSSLPDSGGVCVGQAGMCYDTINNCFYWYSGQAGRENHIYKITPNVGSNWDMSLMSLTGVTMESALGSGINGRIKYFPLLKGIVLSPEGRQSYFIQTSN